MTLEERKVSKYNTFQLVFYPNLSNPVQLTWIIADCETEDSKNSLKICDAIPQFFSTDLSRFIMKLSFINGALSFFQFFFNPITIYMTAENSEKNQ